MTALQAGARIGAYEIISLLGHGAMGEVYRARDTRLGRDVAVKVLAAAFASDPARLARLEREARVISQVNHPYICTLFDIIKEGNTPILILELVEGETIQQRLLRGPMPLRDALRHASGITAALEAAHAKGIIHRDLKPSNITITTAGTVKVLDFGVAKLTRADTESGAPDLTVTLGGTKEGALVGTVAYVSPEQAMGDRIDGRTDIWAFGCLLYEMLTAKRAFPGLAVADTLGAVMRGEPDWTALPPATPPAIRTLLRRCLEKDRARRLANIADARLDIDDLLNGRLDSETTTTLAAPRPSRRGSSIVIVAFLAGIIVATVATRLSLDRQPQDENEPGSTQSPSLATSPQPRSVEPGPSRSEELGAPRATASDNERTEHAASPPPVPTEPAQRFIALPDGMQWAPAVDDGVPNTILALSPDGRRVVFSARQADETALWLRSLAIDDAQRLPGTEGGGSPFWSPDSSSIGFFADRTLKRLDLGGSDPRSFDVSRIGPAVVLADARSQRAGSWGPDDTIVFSPASGGLRRVAAQGGGPVATLTYQERGEQAHFRPQFLYGTRQFLYRVTSSGGRNNRYYVTSLDSPDRRLIATLDAGNMIYAQGHLLFMHSHTLMAQPFDVHTVTTTGPPRPVAYGVLLSSGALPVFGVFSASQNGRLVYLSEADDDDAPMTVLSNWANPR
jgi:serine/threonine protein kinase